MQGPQPSKSDALSLRSFHYIPIERDTADGNTFRATPFTPMPARLMKPAEPRPPSKVSNAIVLPNQCEPTCWWRPPIRKLERPFIDPRTSDHREVLLNLPKMVVEKRLKDIIHAAMIYSRQRTTFAAEIATAPFRSMPSQLYLKKSTELRKRNFEAMTSFNGGMPGMMPPVPRMDMNDAQKKARAMGIPPEMKPVPANGLDNTVNRPKPVVERPVLYVKDIDRILESTPEFRNEVRAGAWLDLCHRVYNFDEERSRSTRLGP